MFESLTEKISDLTNQLIGLSPFDIACVAILFLFCLACFMRGFTRKFFYTLAWVGGLYGGFHGKDWLSPHLKDLITDQNVRSLLSIVIVASGIFVVLRTFGNMLSNSISKTSLKGLDKTMGLLLGFVQGFVFISAAYFFAAYVTEGKLPAIFTEAKVRPYGLEGAEMIRQLLPPDARPGFEIYKSPDGTLLSKTLNQVTPVEESMKSVLSDGDMAQMTVDEVAPETAVEDSASGSEEDLPVADAGI